MEGTSEIQNVLQNVAFLITYTPLRSEVDFGKILSLPLLPAYQIPSRASLDPNEEARKAMDAAGTNRICILIPGRQFDAQGTRHGQGGGWYDRFLAKVPRGWLRIGFCFDDQFSPTPLRRESWDQSMDYVISLNRKTNLPSLYSSEGPHD